MTDPLRRRSLGPPAARSVLLTILGEYGLLRPGGVWQETLVASLVTLGYTEQAARQAVARSTRDGWLVSRRTGRRTRMSLSPATAGMLVEGGERIFGFGGPVRWRGRWLLVVLRVPEERRHVRHQVRIQLTRAGLGSLGGGVWITPHVDREALVRDALASVDHGAEVLSFHAGTGTIGRVEDIVDAWQLAELDAQYREFLERFGRLRPRSPPASFRAQTTMVHAWRKFAFIDPNLPDRLLPDGWPRRRAHRLFHSRHRRWHDPAQRYFDDLGG